MASNAFTSAGTTIGVVADTPATEDSTGYVALTYVNIGEASDISEFGRQYNLVTFNPLGDRRTVKRKGSYNDGAITLQLARVPSDAGQTILQSALDSDTNHSFEVTLQDGTAIYFQAQVLSYTTNVGSVDQITGATVQIEVTTDLVEVAA